MNRKIFNSIFIVAVVVFMAALGLTMNVLYADFYSKHLDSLETKASMTAVGVSNGGLNYLKDLKIRDCHITWTDADGKLKYDNAKYDKNINASDSAKYGKSVQTGDSAKHDDNAKTDSVARKLADGSVICVSSPKFTRLSMLKEILIPIIIIILLAGGLAMFLAFRLSKKIVAPLGSENLRGEVEKGKYSELKPFMEENEQIRKEFTEENELMRKEFTANVSHELKTPLQSISGYAELLKGGLVREKDVPKFSGHIYSESQRMITLVEDLLELSRLDEGVGSMKKEPVDMRELVFKVFGSLRTEADNAGIRLEFEEDEPKHANAGEQDHISVIGYAQMIELIIFNLCENGIKYNHEGGSVRVILKHSADNVSLSVIDDGIGIPKDQQERIFERFYRVDKSRSKKVGGTGLGLSIVKHAAEMHDAEVSLESETGQGTNITIVFPAVA